MPRTAAASLALIAGFAYLATQSACGEHASNSNADAKPAAAANSNSADLRSFSFQDLERYGANVSVFVEGLTTPLEFAYAKMGGDRRWSFQLPAPVGQVVYLEKSGLKYLVIPARSIYADVAPGEQGFQPSALLTPTTPANLMKNRAAERIGIEAVNGRTAMKFRFSGSSADEFEFVDQETRLPIRSDVYILSAKRTPVRLTMDLHDLQLNPDRTQFDIATGMKKVPQDQVKSQLSALVEAIRPFTPGR